MEPGRSPKAAPRKLRNTLERTASREHLGRAIRKRRTELGWTLAELAARWDSLSV